MRLIGNRKRGFYVNIENRRASASATSQLEVSKMLLQIRAQATINKKFSPGKPRRRAGRFKLPPNTREHLPYPTTWTSRSRWKLHPNLGFQRSNSARHLDAPEEKPQIIASDVSAPREQGGASSPLLFSSAASKWKKKRNMVGRVAPVVVAYRKLITNMFVWIWSLLLRPVFRRGSKAELSSSNR